MPAATAVTPSRDPWVEFHGSFTLDPGSIGAVSTEAETVAVPGVRIGDVVTVSPQAALNDGLVIASVRPATDVIHIKISNITAGAIDAASTVFNYHVSRGRKGSVS